MQTRLLPFWENRVMRFRIAIVSLAVFIAIYGCERSHRDAPSAETTPRSAAGTVTPIQLPNVKPASAPTEEDLFEAWVKSQIDVGDVSFVSIVDRKTWPMVPVPNATVVLGIERRPQQGPLKFADYYYLPFVLLAESEAEAKSSSFKSLG